MINVLLVGVCGNMGKSVLECKSLVSDINIAAGIDHNIPLDIKSYKSFENITQKFDVVLDFSNHLLTSNCLTFCRNNSLPLVLCTTGHTKDELAQIKKASKYIPILFSSNMSYGNYVLNKITFLACKLLSDFDVVIEETHHKKKKDAPSGTALSLKKTIKKANKNILDISCLSIRAGTVVGEHTVSFFGNNERIYLTHIAENRNIFAIGALKACKKILGKKPKLYTYTTLFGSR